MKKIIVILFIFISVFTLTSCGKGNNNKDDDKKIKDDGKIDDNEFDLDKLLKNIYLEVSMSTNDSFVNKYTYKSNDGDVYFKMNDEEYLYTDNKLYQIKNETLRLKYEGDDALTMLSSYTSSLTVFLSRGTLSLNGNKESVTYLSRPCTKYVLNVTYDEDYTNTVTVIDNETGLCLAYEGSGSMFDTTTNAVTTLSFGSQDLSVYTGLPLAEK